MSASRYEVQNNRPSRVCNCNVVPGEIRKSTAGLTYAIRSHTNTWLLVSLELGNIYFSHDHGMDKFIDDWPVVYRPE